MKNIFNNAYHNQINNNFEVAEAEYLDCLSHEYKVFDTLNNLGQLYLDTKEWIKAETVYMNMITIDENYIHGYVLLGEVYLAVNNLNSAVKYYTKALKLGSNIESVYNNLGLAYKNLNQRDNAIDTYIKGLLIFDKSELLHYNFSNIIRTQALSKEILNNKNIQVLLESCLQYEKNEYQRYLVPIYSYLFDKYSLDGYVFSDENSSLLLENSLFQHALRKIILSNIDLEGFLIKRRKNILENILDESYSRKQLLQLKNFIVSLAFQCFWTEYVFMMEEVEYKLLEELKQKIKKSLENRDKKVLVYIALYGCYKPLDLEEFITNQFFIKEKDKSNLYTELYTTLISQPKEEEKLKRSIICLKPLIDLTSKKVAHQYEENPYPRWTSIIHISSSILTDKKLFKKTLYQKKLDASIDSIHDVLVAGTGTGQHPITIALDRPNTNITGIDLSKSSIAYAQRKVNEMSVENLKFLQGDLLDVELLNKKFDLVESFGVLHHMENPIEGWTTLTNVLKVNGFMKIGLYSELARKSVVETISFIEEKAYKAEKEDIKKCRDDIRHLEKGHSMRKLAQYRDFYSVSGARDLIFNVQEHRYTIPEIQSILNTLNLTFLGFVFRDEEVYSRYFKMFPDDLEATNLQNWHIFEIKYENTFIEMYQMWLQKK